MEFFLTDLETQLDERIPVARAIQKLRGNETQATATARAGLTEPAWSEYESGQRLPSLVDRTRIAVGLGVSLIRLEQEIWIQRAQQLLEWSAFSSTATTDQPQGVDLAEALRLLVQGTAHQIELFGQWIEENLRARSSQPGGGNQGE